MRRFDHGSRLVATVATIGLAQLLTAGAGLLPRLWGERFVTDRLPAPFTASLTIDPIVFDANSILAVIIAPAAIAAVALVLLRTRAGLGVRAAADDSARAATLGIDVGRLRSGVWAAAALLAFVATVLRAGILGLPIGSALTLGVLLRALAAVVVGGPSLPGIALAGVGIGVLEQGVAWGEWRLLPTPADPTSPLLIDPILAVVVLAAIAMRRRSTAGGRRAEVADGLVDAGTPPAAGPWPRWASLVVFAVAAAAPHFLDADTSLRGSAVLIYAVLGLSIVVLTGWTGQVSLAQVAFFALGAAVAAKVTNDAGLDLTVGLAAAAGAGAAAAVLVGLPVVRLRGVTLAVATLAVALGRHQLPAQRSLLRVVAGGPSRPPAAARAHRPRFAHPHLVRGPRRARGGHRRHAGDPRQPNGPGPARRARQRAGGRRLRAQRRAPAPVRLRPVGRSGRLRRWRVRAPPAGVRLEPVRAAAEPGGARHGRHRRRRLDRRCGARRRCTSRAASGCCRRAGAWSPPARECSSC